MVFQEKPKESDMGNFKGILFEETETIKLLLLSKKKQMNGLDDEIENKIFLRTQRQA